MLEVTVDTTHDFVSVALRSGHLFRFRRKWTEFYALLALCLREEPQTRFVSAKELRSVGRWRHIKDELTVGRTVSNHLIDLRKKGLGGCVDFQNKTDGWRLSASNNRVRVDIENETLRQWLQQRGWEVSAAPEVVPDPAHLQWVVAITRALFELQVGNIESSLSFARESASLVEEPLLRGVSDSVVLTALVRRGSTETDLEEIEQVHNSIHDANVEVVGEALRARADTAKALASLSSDASNELPRLRALATRLETSREWTSLAVVYNMIGILYKRMGDYSEAAKYIQSAIPLFALANDLPRLQAGLCNLAQVLCLQYKNEPNEDRDKMINGLFDTEYDLVTSFGFGKDSGQAEVVAARFALRRGDLPRAKKFFDLASQICTESERDQAPLTWTQARIILAEAKQETKLGAGTISRALGCLQTARKLYGLIGETYPTLDAEIAQLEAQLALQTRKKVDAKF